MTWSYFWAFLIAPLFIIIYLFRAKAKPATILYSSITNFKDSGGSFRLALRQLLLFISSLATVVLLTLAAARPQNISIINQPRAARNIMLALDLSGSMRTHDFYVNRQAVDRLQAVKLVVAEFVSNRKDDRLGLVVFGTQAFLQCPLTNDHGLLQGMLSQLQHGLAGDGTAIGDGLGLAIKRLEAVSGDSKAIVLLTDGVNTSGTVDPIQAAKVASDLKIKVHTVGIGASDTARRAGSNIFGSQHTKQYEFDEKTLKNIAINTGGVYFNAKNLEELQQVYQAIDELEKTEQSEPEIPQVEERYWHYALYALIAYLIYLLTNNFLLVRIPW